jgi:hypothetical protein
VYGGTGAAGFLGTVKGHRPRAAMLRCWQGTLLRCWQGTLLRCWQGTLGGLVAADFPRKRHSRSLLEARASILGRSSPIRGWFPAPSTRHAWAFEDRR